MSDDGQSYSFEGCCHPASGPHGPGEPGNCCHTHAEDLPAQGQGLGEPPEPPRGWTAQGAHQEAVLTQRIAEIEKQIEDPHHHKL